MSHFTTISTPCSFPWYQNSISLMHYFFSLAFSNSSASLFFVPVLSVGSKAAPLPLSLTDALFFNLSLSSGLRSVFLVSSSSESPRLKGSLSSATGAGARDVKGCHFLPDFAEGDGPLFCGGVGLRYKASTSSMGPDGTAGVALNKSGFA